jgi:1-acyl-sn-glycerol-3-phosphate acyltransferase
VPEPAKESTDERNVADFTFGNEMVVRTKRGSQHRGESVLVFPEGTFTPQVGVRPFQLGAFKAAASAHCPILPVALQGTRNFLRDGTYLRRPSRITVTICPQLEVQPTRANLCSSRVLQNIIGSK